MLVKLSAGQKTLGHLCRSKFYYPVHQSLPVDFIVSHINPLHTFTHQCLKVPVVVLPLNAYLFPLCSLGFSSQYSVCILNLSPCYMPRPFRTLAGWWLMKHNKCYWMTAVDHNATEIQTGYLWNFGTCYHDTLKHEAAQCCCTNMRHKRAQSIRRGDAIRAHVHWRHPTLCFQTFVISGVLLDSDSHSKCQIIVMVYLIA